MNRFVSGFLALTGLFLTCVSTEARAEKESRTVQNVFAIKSIEVGQSGILITPLIPSYSTLSSSVQIDIPANHVPGQILIPIYTQSQIFSACLSFAQQMLGRESGHKLEVVQGLERIPCPERSLCRPGSRPTTLNCKLELSGASSPGNPGGIFPPDVPPMPE